MQKRHSEWKTKGKRVAPSARVAQSGQGVTVLPMMEKIFGIHSVRAIFLTRPHAIRRIIILAGQEPYLEDLIELARRAKIKPEILPLDKFLRIANFTEEERRQKHQGIYIFAEPRTIYSENDLDTLRDARVILALDQVSNPQNLAAILRNAAFFGVDAVLLLKNRSASLTPEVVRIAVGGAEYVRIFEVINLARSLDKLKTLGFWVYGLDERGEKTLAETDFGDQTVLVVGAEGEGLRHRTREFCDALVRIPGGRPGLGSLNVGVATAVAVAELFR
jgi:23S rRNA (guanosine2251-2'-O)-methyltransferase